MARDTNNSGQNIQQKTPYDLMALGILMILAGLIDIGIILKNPDYEMPIFGMKLPGKAGWYFILIVFPLFHFIAGYGAFLARKWAYYVYVIPTLYIIASAAVSLMRLPPPHRIRTTILITMPIFLIYLFWRKKHFRS